MIARILGSQRYKRDPSPLSFLSLLLFAFVATACASVHLVSAYDDITDKSATDLQHKVDHFLLKMESSAGTPAGVYDANPAMYDELQADVDALHVRAAAVPNNHLTLIQVEALDQALADLRKLHEKEGERGLRHDIAEPSRTAFTTIFTAIIKFELAKKRGETSSTR